MKLKLPRYDRSRMTRIRQNIRQLNDASRSTTKQLDGVMSDLKQKLHKVESQVRTRARTLSLMKRHRKDLARQTESLEIQLQSSQNAAYMASRMAEAAAAKSDSGASASELAAARSEIAKITQEKMALQNAIALIDGKIDAMKVAQRDDANRITSRWAAVSALVESGRTARVADAAAAAQRARLAGGRRAKRATRRRRRRRRRQTRRL